MTTQPTIQKPLKCGRCGANRGSLYFDTVRHNSQCKAEHSWKCRLCSWSTEPVVEPTKKPQLGRVEPIKSQRKMEKCPVCEHGRFEAARNKIGLCCECGNKQRKWEAGSKTQPTPFIKRNGTWTVNTAGVMTISTLTLNFPATVFSEKNTTGEQLGHFMSEIDEINESIMTNEKVERHEEEIFDAWHSLEGVIRTMVRNKGEKYVLDGMNKVITKNDNRNYYGGK